MQKTLDQGHTFDMTSILSIAEWMEMKSMTLEMKQNQNSLQNALISAENLNFLHISNENMQRLTWQKICLALRNPKLEILHLGMLLFEPMDFSSEAKNFVTGLMHSKLKCLNICWLEGCEMMPKIVFDASLAAL